MKNTSYQALLALLFLFCATAIFYLLYSTLPANSDLVLENQIFWILKLPRFITAIAVGGGLAVSGLVLQSIFKNPLADPFTTGVSSAAVFGAILGSLFKQFSFIGSTLLAFCFAFAVLIFLATFFKRRSQPLSQVLLIGILLGFFFSALATFALFLADPLMWTATLSWIYGSLNKLSLLQATITLVATLLFSLILWLHSRELDLICVAEYSAESAGLKPQQVQTRSFILVSFITALAVATSGLIGFIGLIVPHLVRKVGLHRHRLAIAANLLVGASVLLIADFLSRNLLPPNELPVGILLSLIGVPFLFFMIKK